MHRSINKTESRRNLSLLLSLGMVLGLALLVGMYGCPGSTPKPPPPGPECEVDADCDDGVFCNGAETCDVEAGECLPGTPPCAEELCIEEEDRCLECLEDADCEDDGLFCTGDPVCAEDGTCGFSGDPCEEGETCNEDEDRCEIQEEGDFAAANPGVDFDGFFAGADVELNAPLPEGDFTAAQVSCTFVGWAVNGAGTFDPADATPTMYTPAVGDTEITATWDCGGVIYALSIGVTVSAEPECTVDADCDDGLFCTGDWICTNGVCQVVPGSRPCNDQGDGATERCEEGDTSAICIPLTVTAVMFTLGQDDLIGTSANDVFSAPLAFNEGTGTQLPTLQNGDSANGLGGTDTLNVTFTHAANTTVQPTLEGIEIFNITDFTPTGVTTTFSMANVTGVEVINSLNSSADAVTITNLNTVVDLGVATTASDLAVTWIAPATNANDDEAVLTLNGAKEGCTVTLTTPANGIETLNIETETAASKLDALAHAAATLTTLTVGGDQNLTITGALPASLTTINAGAATGNTVLSVGGTANVTYTGGTGDDTVLFDVAGGYTAADTIDGGTGTNTLGMQSAEAVAASALTANQTNVTNITNLRITNALNGAIIASKFGATNAILDTVPAATALTGGASTVTVPGGTPAVTLNNDDTAHALTVTVAGSGTADVLAFNAMNADLGAGLTINGAETVNYMSANGEDGTAADDNKNTATTIALAPTFGAGTLNFTGTVAVELTGAVTAGTINASGLTAALTMGAATVAGGGASITGTGLNDTLWGSVNDDQINGGDGNDLIVGWEGNDVLLGGNGRDTFYFRDATANAAYTGGANILSDFVIGSDYLQFKKGDYWSTATGGGTPTAVTTALFYKGAVASMTPATTYEVVVITDQGYANVTAADVAVGAVSTSANDGVVVYFDTTDNEAKMYWTTTLGTAGVPQIVATFPTITQLSQLASFANTDFLVVD